MKSNSRAVNSRAGVFRFGEYAFDCQIRQLLCNGEPRHLSPKAQQLLHLLLLARPRALAREELYDALWPSTFVCETNLASVVNEVRRGLGDDARAPQYIRTIHGFGYAFCGEVRFSEGIGIHAATLTCDGHRYQLHEGGNTVGRAHDSHVVLSDATVSRRHALITIDDGSISIRDLDSKNGTYVDGQRIGTSPVIVKSHTQIELGALKVSIVLPRVSSTASLRLNTELKREVAARLATMAGVTTQ